MPGWLDIAEVAALILVAYLIGCTVGYGAHAMVRRPVAARAAAPKQAPIRRPSAAARLAASIDDDAVTPAVVPKSVVAATPVAKPVLAAKPVDVAKPAPAAKPLMTDLRAIKGIGPKIAASLEAAGIESIEQIALWTDDDIARFDARLAFPGRIRRERWVEQAIELVNKA